MESARTKSGLDRRKFLTATGGGLLAAALPGSAKIASAAESASTPLSHTPAAPPAKAPGNLRKIPIGVFDPVYENLNIDQVLDTVKGLGLEAMEIGTGGYPNNRHCPLDDLVAD